MAVTERFKKYLTWDWTSIFKIDPEFARRIDLDQTEVNNRFNKLQRGTFKACSALETNRSSILDFDVKESISIPTFLTG
jgi:hypothetical protein